MDSFIRIRSDADRQRAVILAEAVRDAQMKRGEGDAVAASEYAAAYSRSPEFYSYQRWLEAMKKSFSENSRMVLTNQSPLLNLQR